MYRETLCVVLFLSVANAAKILGIFMTTSYSHQIIYQPVWKELSLRGHQVTVYTPNPINDPSLTNLTEIDLSFSYEVWNKHSLQVFGKRTSQMEQYKRVSAAFLKVFEAQMSSPQMQDLILNRNNETYDLLLMEFFYPSMYPFKDVFKCPMIGMISLAMTISGAESLGVMKHPVLDPDNLLPFSHDLSFKERVISTLFYFLYKTQVALSVGSKFTAEAKRFFGENTRYVFDVAKEVSLVLGNSNFATQAIRPIVPAFVDISGIHLKPPKPLPKDLKEILDEAKEGVIYFSLGTNIKPRHLPKQGLQNILDAFSELPYKVLWKSEEDLANSSKIITSTWWPQHDVLRHPNVKLFITQGGLQSIDESLTAKTPMLIIPFYADQFYNAHKMTSSGTALTIAFDDFTKEELKEKIVKLITEQQFKQSAAKLAEIAFDQPITPLDKAVWWIEYVLRHDGAPHLRYKAVDMPFYQYYLLDVFLFLGFITYIVYYVLIKVSRRLIMAYYVLRRHSIKIGFLCINASDKKSQ